MIEREETFEYNSYRLSRNEKNCTRSRYICEKYSMKSTLPSEEDFRSVDE